MVKYTYYTPLNYSSGDVNDPHYGLLMSMSGTGDSFSDDGWGNITESESTQTYSVIYGTGKIRQSETYSLTQNADSTWGDTTMTVTYAYDPNGALVDAEGIGETFGFTKEYNYVRGSDREGSGSVLAASSTSHGTFIQEYAIMANNAYLWENTSTTFTEFIDGMTATAVMDTTYSYDDNYYFARLTGAHTEGETISTEIGYTTNADPASGGFGDQSLVVVSQTRTLTSQESDAVFNQAKLLTTFTRSYTDLLDEEYDNTVDWGVYCEGGWSYAETELEYTYLMGGIGKLDRVVLRDYYGDSGDGFGSFTVSDASQNYTIIHGRPVLLSSTVTSTTTDVSGVTATTIVDTTNTVDKDGRIYGVDVTINHLSYEDSYENTYHPWSQQWNDIYYGKSKVYLTESGTIAEYVDDAFSVSSMSTDYGYDSVGRLNYAFSSGGYNPNFPGENYPNSEPAVLPNYNPISVTDPSQHVGNWSDDGWGNQTTSSVRQTYFIMKGRAVVERSKTDTRIFNYDGSGGWSVTDMVYDLHSNVGYAVQDLGHYYGATGVSRSLTNTVGYDYVEAGYSGPEGSDHVVAIAKTDTTTTQDFNVWKNRVKAVQAEAVSDTYIPEKDPDLTTYGNHALLTLLGGTTTMVTTYVYNIAGDGELVSAMGIGNAFSQEYGFTTDTGTGDLIDALTVISETNTTITQQLSNKAGKAKIASSSTHSVTDLLDEEHDFSVEWELSCAGGKVINDVTIIYEYTDNKLSGAHAENATGVSTDGFGSITNSDIYQIYIINAGKALVQTATTDATTQDVEGSDPQHTLTRSDHYYDTRGRLQQASVTLTHDPYKDRYGNTIRIWSGQKLAIYYGAPKVEEVSNTTRVESIDQSVNVSNITITNTYSDYGRLIETTGGGGIRSGYTVSGVHNPDTYVDATFDPLTTSDNTGNWSDDGYGNQSTSSITQDYWIMNGRAIVQHSRTDTSIFNYDGSGGYSITDMEYEISELGHYLGASATTNSYINQVGYSYVPSIPGALNPNDVVVISRTDTLSTQGFNVWKNRVKVVDSDSYSTTYVPGKDPNLAAPGDRATSFPILGATSTIGTTYTYDLTDSARLVNASATGHAVSYEYGYTTDTSSGAFDDTLIRISQTDTDITQTLINIAGKPKISSSFSHSVTDFLDAELVTANIDWNYESTGAKSISDVGLNYFYTDARLSSVSAAVSGSSEDGLGNTTNSTITQTYIISNGKALLSKAITDATTDDIETSDIRSVTTADYFYDGRDRMYQNTVSIVTDPYEDRYGNTIEPKTEQLLAIYYGAPKVETSKSRTRTENLDGSVNVSNIQVTNSYSDFGRLHFATGGGGYNTAFPLGSELSVNAYITPIDTSSTEGNWSDDGYGNQSTSNITQNFWIINGKAVLHETNTDTSIFNYDGSGGTSHIDMIYNVTEKGHYSGAKATGSSLVNEVGMKESEGTVGLLVQIGRTDTSTTQEFNVWHNRLKLAQNISHSETDIYKDTVLDTDNASVTDLTVIYFYNPLSGELVDAIGGGTFSGTNWEYIQGTSGAKIYSTSSGNIVQEYTIYRGQAKMDYSEVNTTAADFNPGSITNEHTTSLSETYYTYDGDGVLTGGHIDSNSTTEITVEGTLASQSTSSTYQSLIPIRGKAKAGYSKTSSRSDNYLSDSWSETTDLHIDYTYEPDRGWLLGAVQPALMPAVINGEDHYGNVTAGTTRQKLKILYGQAKPYEITTSTTATVESIEILSEQQSTLITDNTYNPLDGRLAGVHAYTQSESPATSKEWGRFTGTGRWGVTNYTESTINQTYSVYNGRGMITHADINMILITGPDLGGDHTYDGSGASDTYYTYDSGGDLVTITGGSYSYTSGSTWDGNGTWSNEVTTTNTYGKVYNTPRLLSSISFSQYNSSDSSTGNTTDVPSYSETIYTYRTDFDLLVSSAQGTSWIDQGDPAVEYFGLSGKFNYYWTGIALFDSSDNYHIDVTYYTTTNMLKYLVDPLSGKLKLDWEWSYTVSHNDPGGTEETWVFNKRSVKHTYGPDGGGTEITNIAEGASVERTHTIEFPDDLDIDDIEIQYIAHYWVGDYAGLEHYGDYGPELDAAITPDWVGYGWFEGGGSSGSDFSPFTDGVRDEHVKRVNGKETVYRTQEVAYTEFLWNPSNDVTATWYDDMSVSVRDIETLFTGQSGLASPLDKYDIQTTTLVHTNDTYQITGTVGGAINIEEIIDWSSLSEEDWIYILQQIRYIADVFTEMFGENWFWTEGEGYTINTQIATDYWSVPEDKSEKRVKKKDKKIVGKIRPIRRKLLSESSVFGKARYRPDTRSASAFTQDLFTTLPQPAQEQRTIHLGLLAKDYSRFVTKPYEKPAAWVYAELSPVTLMSHDIVSKMLPEYTEVGIVDLSIPETVLGWNRADMQAAEDKMDTSFLLWTSQFLRSGQQGVLTMPVVRDYFFSVLYTVTLRDYKGFQVSDNLPDVFSIPKGSLGVLAERGQQGAVPITPDKGKKEDVSTQPFLKPGQDLSDSGSMASDEKHAVIGDIADSRKGRGLTLNKPIAEVKEIKMPMPVRIVKHEEVLERGRKDLREGMSTGISYGLPLLDITPQKPIQEERLITVGAARGEIRGGEGARPIDHVLREKKESIHGRIVKEPELGRVGLETELVTEIGLIGQGPVQEQVVPSFEMSSLVVATDTGGERFIMRSDEHARDIVIPMTDAVVQEEPVPVVTDIVREPVKELVTRKEGADGVPKIPVVQAGVPPVVTVVSQREERGGVIRERGRERIPVTRDIVSPITDIVVQEEPVPVVTAIVREPVKEPVTRKEGVDGVPKVPVVGAGVVEVVRPVMLVVPVKQDRGVSLREVKTKQVPVSRDVVIPITDAVVQEEPVPVVTDIVQEPVKEPVTRREEGAGIPVIRDVKVGVPEVVKPVVTVVPEREERGAPIRESGREKIPVISDIDTPLTDVVVQEEPVPVVAAIVREPVRELVTRKEGVDGVPKEPVGGATVPEVVKPVMLVVPVKQDMSVSLREVKAKQGAVSRDEVIPMTDAVVQEELVPVVTDIVREPVKEPVTRKEEAGIPVIRDVKVGVPEVVRPVMLVVPVKHLQYT
ncbi:hypothetical protein ACFL1T_04425 [Chlamydiota bacterium]